MILHFTFHFTKSEKKEAEFFKDVDHVFTADWN